MQINGYAPPMWSARGQRAESPDPRVQVFDLGQDVVRLQFPDGTMRLDGLVEHDLPAMARKEGAAVRLQIDPDAVWEKLKKPEGATQSLTLSGGASAEQNALDANGFQFSRLRPAADRDAVDVYSQGPLSTAMLDNMAAAMRDLPPEPFKGGHTTIAVVDWTGEFIQDGEKLTYGGLTYGDTGRMFLTRDQVADPDAARATLWHESAHILDTMWQRFGHPYSEVARAADGRWIFGHGTYIESPPHAPLYPHRGETTDASHSDYVSRYASSNAMEDLAETHAMVIQLDQDYRRTHNGSDLLHANDAASFLQQRQLSHGLNEKVMAILDAYHGQGLPPH